MRLVRWLVRWAMLRWLMCWLVWLFIRSLVYGANPRLPREMREHGEASNYREIHYGSCVFTVSSASCSGDNSRQMGYDKAHGRRMYQALCKIASTNMGLVLGGEVKGGGVSG